MAKKENIFVLWRQTSKEGKKYLTGHDEHGLNLIGFYSNTSPNLKIYVKPDSLRDKINFENPIGMLDVTRSKKGDMYLRGTYSGIAVSAFINTDKKNKKSPDITAYIASTNGSTQVSIYESDEDLPF